MEVKFRLLQNQEKSRIEIISNYPYQVKFIRNKESKYQKVTKQKKEILINQVLYNDKSIIEVAEELQINYSTAKSILLNFKKHKMYQCDDCVKQKQTLRRNRIYNTRSYSHKIKLEN